jgi:hypothetical protein
MSLCSLKRWKRNRPRPVSKLWPFPTATSSKSLFHFNPKTAQTCLMQGPSEIPASFAILMRRCQIFGVADLKSCLPARRLIPFNSSWGCSNRLVGEKPAFAKKNRRRARHRSSHAWLSQGFPSRLPRTSPVRIAFYFYTQAFTVPCIESTDREENLFRSPFQSPQKTTPPAFRTILETPPFTRAK